MSSYNRIRFGKIQNILSEVLQSFTFRNSCTQFFEFDFLYNHCLFLLLSKYALTGNGEVPSIYRYVKEHHPISDCLGEYIPVNSNRYYKAYKDYYKRRDSNYKTGQQPQSVYDLELVHFLITARQEIRFLNYAWDDRIPDIKNYSIRQMKNDFEKIEGLYKDICQSKDSYLLKSMKFFLLEKYTYYEHFYQLAQLLTNECDDKTQERCYYAYNMRYVKDILTNETLYFPFMTNVNRMCQYYLEDISEQYSDSALLFGCNAKIVFKVVQLAYLEIFSGDKHFDIDDCPRTEAFCEGFFGRGQHITEKTEQPNAFYKNLHSMYRKELSYDELCKHDEELKIKKKALNDKRPRKLNNT